MTNELIKAIWKSGFRAGYEDGADDQLNYVWGGGGHTTSPEKGWKEWVVPYLDGGPDNAVDVNTVEAWDDIP
jgi:hypothetical protein